MRRCTIELPDSVSLEGRLRIYKDATMPHAGLIIIHPYSMLGGSMYDTVVGEISRQAQASRQFGAILLYNQRGVGESQGSKVSMKNAVGQQDAGDVSHVIEYLYSKMTASICQTEQQNDPAVMKDKIKIGVVGYSFGAALASCGLDHPSVHAMVAISFPLGLVTKLLGTEKYLDKLCNAPSHVNRLLVIGAQDQYTNIGKLKVKIVESGGRIFQNFSTSASLQESMMVLDKVVDSMLLPVSTSSDGITSNNNLMCLQVFESNDHFWSSDCALMVEFVIKYLSNLFVTVVSD